jgi:NADH-quinone oxidoreductase subunit L
MVTAGVYMVCRLSFLFSASTTAMIVISTVGMLTALAAAFMAMTQTDAKKVLAYSTVSQLGFMFVAAGTGNWLAAIFNLGAHAFFKACLFLGAGSIMHGMEHGGSKTPGDIRTMGGLRKHMPVTRWTFWIACLAISGIFPFSGFFSKDEILSGAWSVTPPGWPPGYGKVLWAGLLIAALGTAFYMWRLYFMIFSGEERSEEARHAHESPRSMTSALVVLAALASVAGFIGLPELHVHMPSAFHALGKWLEPSVTSTWFGTKTPNLPIHGEAHDATTLVLIGIALTMGALGIALAWVLYGRGPSPTVAKLTDGPLAELYQASKHKLWVDELYDSAFVKPFRALARGLFAIVDRFVIDTVAVNGVAFVIGVLGRISRWFQNGQVQRYLAGIVVGGAAVFFFTSWHASPTFTYRQLPGDQLALHAAPGAGLVGEKATLHWHLDGSTDCTFDLAAKSDPADITVHAGDVGAQVTLCIDDPISQKTHAVTRTIELGAAAPAEATP